jgi:signal transduction histidine kinase
VTRRLLVSYLTLAAFVLAVLEIPLGIVFARNEQSNLTSAVERDATVIAGVAEDALERGVATDLASVVSTYRRRTGGRVVIVDAGGISVADSDPRGPGRRDFSTRTEIVTALGGAVATGARYSNTLAQRLLYVAVPVTSGGVVHGAVRITYPIAALDRRITRNWAILAAVALVVLAAAALASLLIAHWVGRPLRDLQTAALALSHGELSTRADTDSGPPEVQALAAAFNTMATRLGELLASQRSFVADASHQLRTPLTALRLRLENLQAVIDDSDAGELEAAIEETSRLARLVQGLLTLARAEASQTPPEAFDIAAALRERRDAWQALADEQDIALRLEAPPLPPALAMPGAPAQMLDNLIANATRVAPPGTAITLSAHRQGDSIELHVTDQGPGMPDEERRRAFDRFWRKNGSDGDGFGLGLAIVHRLAVASGGTVELRAADHGGLDAVITLPVTTNPQDTHNA